MDHKRSPLVVAGLCWLGLLASGGLLEAQTAAVITPAQFDVASVKPNRSLDAARRVGFSQAGFNATNVTLVELIRAAYGFQPGLQTLASADQMVGASGWMNSDRFDIVARAASPVDFGNGGQAALLAMLRALLAERFSLAVHEDMRDAPVYALVVNRPGQLGARIRRSTLDCDDFFANRPGGMGKAAMCGFTVRPGRMFGPTNMPTLVVGLTQTVDRVVLDKTELMGVWDVELEWVPDNPATRAAASDPNTGAAVADGASIFTALQEQLGLRLQTDRGPVRVVVIDRASQPTPD